MAAGATKTYTALFQIGGKLLGSFKGTMQMAEARLKRLRATAANIGGAFKGLGGVLASFAGGFAGFTIGKVFSSMFSGAVEDAKEAEVRFKTIQITMLKNAQLMRQANGDRAKALVLAKEQTELITAQSDRLAEQGVLADDVYNAMARQMSVAGVPTKSILRSVGAMGDLLVAIKGVSASEADAAQLADAMNKAIFQGKTKALVPFIGAMPKDWWKDQIKQGHGYQDMLDDLLKRMQFAKGSNVAEALTPLGKLQRYQNHLKKMREDIGGQMIPIQAQMAEMWDKALPEMKPAILFAFKGLMFVMRKLAQLVVQYVMPAFKKLQAWWQSQTPQAQKRWLLIAAAIAAVMAALVLLGAVALPVIAAIVAALSSPVTGAIAAIVASVIGMMVFWRFAGSYITAAASATWEFLKAGWQVLSDFFVMLWQAVSPELAAIWEDIKIVVSVFWDWFKVATQAAINVFLTIWRTVEPVVQPILNKIKEAWQFIVDAFEKAKPTIVGVLKEIGKVFLDWLLEPLKKFRWIFDKVAAAINRFRPGGAAFAGGGGGFGGTGGGSGWGAPGGVAAGAGAAAGFAGAAGGIAGIAGAAGAAAGAATGGGMPVTVASYGGPTEPGQTIGAYNNALRPGDVAISPNLYPILGKPGPDNYVMLDGKRYHVADASFYTPGNPTSNMVEIWGYGNQIKRAGTVAKAYQHGGIAAASQLAMLGESGPEAVIPLSGGRRAEGLLNFASRALGMPAAHTTSVSFSPSIVIHGNATEAEQRAMDSRLRDLKDDFIKQFEQAQRQERRLSYEGGYA